MKKTTFTKDLPEFPNLCNHHGKVDVFTHHDGLLVSAGDKHIIPELTDEVVLDLADRAEPMVRIVGQAQLPNTSSYQTYTRIVVDWPDLSVPGLYTRFWKGLVADIVQEQHNLVIVCFGGHGRTGTALAIIASLLYAVPENACPVRWVRDHYCKEAVETRAQARYIAAVTGREVLTKVIDPLPSTFKGATWNH